MIKRSFTAVLLAITVVTAARAQDSASTKVSDPVVTGLVKVADEIKLPGKEPGVLLQLAVREGAEVRSGDIIGKIDDSEPQMQKKAASAAYAAAYEKWKDDVELRFAKATADVTQGKTRLDQ